MGIPNRFPETIDNDAAFQDIARSGVFGDFGPSSPFLSPAAPIAALGSCFADNITAHLQKMGYDILELGIIDRLYTPTALKYFFENLDGDTSLFQKHWRRGADQIEEFAKRIIGGAAVIITFGMSVEWVDTETGETIFDPTVKVKRDLILQGERYAMRQTALDENIEAISAMISAIRRLNRSNKIILTLSPHPLVFSNELPVVVADCISKSTLRIAIAEVMRAKLKDVYYYPSYEMLKWLAPMVGQIWGAESLISHVRDEWINYTLDQFAGMYCVGHTSRVAPPVGTYPIVPPLKRNG